MRVPKAVCEMAGVGGFASLVDGEWRVHPSADAARMRAFSWGGIAVTIVGKQTGKTISGDARPYGNRSGKHTTPRRQLGGTAEQWAKLDTLASDMGKTWQQALWALLERVK